MVDELQPGDTIGDYKLETRLGGGGFGSVWKAYDGAGGRAVAVKALRTDVYSADTIRMRADVELLAATASSRSPHVVKVFGGGIEPQPYVVMEFIDGVDLGRELERRTRIPQAEVIRIGAAVANALAALESVGIIHRDIKPANVMIDVDGIVKLTDFGIAKIVGYDTITATSQMPMSMAYAAPEVWEGTATHKSDLYSLGILLFQCLAGRPPFTGSYAQVYRQHATAQPDWTLLPEGTVPEVRRLLRDCLAKAQSDRPADASEVAARLAQAEAELTVRAQSAGAATDLPAHEPQAFGPLLRREKHPTQDWAFLCIHETTGERATVEVHFSDDIEHGSRLRKAVEVNPKLVPLGAERLLGTNRLVLRPGEAWSDAPSGPFQFWVAREELAQPRGVDRVDETMLGHATAALTSLRSAARDSNLDLLFDVHSLGLLRDGRVSMTRPGLAKVGDDGLAWLRTLPLDEPARQATSRAQSLAELASFFSSRIGVAEEPPTIARSDPELLTLVQSRSDGLSANGRPIQHFSPSAQPGAAPAPLAAHSSESVTPVAGASGSLRRPWALRIAVSGGLVLFTGLVAAGVYARVSGNRGPSEAIAAAGGATATAPSNASGEPSPRTISSPTLDAEARASLTSTGGTVSGTNGSPETATPPSTVTPTPSSAPTITPTPTLAATPTPTPVAPTQSGPLPKPSGSGAPNTTWFRGTVDSVFQNGEPGRVLTNVRITEPVNGSEVKGTGVLFTVGWRASDCPGWRDSVAVGDPVEVYVPRGGVQYADLCLSANYFLVRLSQ